jgi:hypothetical protein
MCITHKDSGHASQGHCACIMKTSLWKLYKEVMAMFCKNHAEYINTMYGENAELLVLNLVVHTLTTML